MSIDRGLDFACIKARYACDPYGWRIDRRFSEPCVLGFAEQTLVYVFRGRAVLQAAGENTEVERGDLITVAAGVDVGWRVSEPVELKVALRSEIERLTGVRSLRDRLTSRPAQIATGAFVPCGEPPQIVRESIPGDSLIFLYAGAGPIFCALFPLGESRGACLQIALADQSLCTIAGLDHAGASVALDLDRAFTLSHAEELFLKHGDGFYRFAGSGDGQPLGQLVLDRLRQLRLPEVTEGDTATLEAILDAVLEWARDDKWVRGVALLYLPQAVRVSKAFCVRWNIDICYANRSLLTVWHSDGPQADIVIESLTTEPVRCSLAHYPGGHSFAKYELVVATSLQGGRRVISSAVVDYGD